MSVETLQVFAVASLCGQVWRSQRQPLNASKTAALSLSSWLGGVARVLPGPQKSGPDLH